MLEWKAYNLPQALPHPPANFCASKVLNKLKWQKLKWIVYKFVKDPFSTKNLFQDRLISQQISGWLSNFVTPSAAITLLTELT